MKYILAVLVFFLFACDSDSLDNLTRYNHVTIPGFEAEDYIELLSDPDPEIVYNSICNLIPMAGTYGDVLSDGMPTNGQKDYDEKVQLFKFSSNLYNQICELVKSDELLVRCSSIHFLKHFGDRYNNKDDVIKRLLEVKLGDHFTEFELASALTHLGSSGSPVDNRLLIRFRDNKSWLVSRSLYSLVNSLENSEMRKDMVRRYNQESDLKEKLLILSAFSENYESEIFHFLLKEYVDNGNELIKEVILDIITEPGDIDYVCSWIDKNYAKMHDDIIRTLVKDAYDNLDGSLGNKIIIIALNRGYDFSRDEKNETLTLFYYLEKELSDLLKKKELKDYEKDDLKMLQDMESMLLNSKYSEEWREYKRIQAIPKYSPELVKEHKTALENYLETTRKLLLKHGVKDPSEVIKELREDNKLP